MQNEVRWLIIIVLATILLVVTLMVSALGLWASVWGWALIALFAFPLLRWSYSEMDRKVFKKTCVFVLICLLLVAPAYGVLSTVEDQSIAQNLATPKEIDYFRNLLGRHYNYTVLIQWKNATVHWNNSSSMIVYTDPIEIYEYHQARCGGYAILYAELCISQGYQCRIVDSIFTDHEWNEVKIDGNWTRVDASPTGAPMNENIGYPLFYEEKWHTPPILALAFENSSVVDVTSNYRSDHWSLMSFSTIVFVFISAWFAVCIFLIWKKLIFPARFLESIIHKQPWCVFFAS